MSVYVDDIYLPAQLPGMRPAIWCHLTADTKQELHDFAQSIGLRRSWFQDKPHGAWHYDVTKSVRAKAVRAGAIQVPWRNFHEIWMAPGREGR